MSSYIGGVKNRRKRALQRNEAQLALAASNIETLSKQKVNMENNPKLFDEGNYRAITTRIGVYKNSIVRLEKEISTLKTRI